jgi:hypothetical protein
MARAINPQGIVIDVDDTLSHTSLVCARYLHQHFTPNDDIPFDQLLSEYGYAERAPQWSSSESVERLHLWLTDLDFIAQLPPIPEAQAGIKKVLEKVPLAFYLTSRQPFSYDVTVNWLQRYGFPEAEVICRPPATREPDWKVRFLTEHYPQTVGLIDNEIHVPDDFTYTGHLFELILHKKVTPAHPRLDVCKSWDEVVKILEQE